MREDYTISQDHPDLKVLAEELTKQGLSFEKDSYWDGKGFIDTEFPTIRGASVSSKEGPSKEGNYIRLPYTYNWNDNDVAKVKTALYNASNRSEKTYFELHSVTDQEWDDDRTWDASFTFFSLSKAG